MFKTWLGVLCYMMIQQIQDGGPPPYCVFKSYYKSVVDYEIGIKLYVPVEISS